MDNNTQTKKAMAQFESLNLKRMLAVKQVIASEMNIRPNDHRLIVLASLIVEAVNRIDP